MAGGGGLPRGEESVPADPGGGGPSGGGSGCGGPSSGKGACGGGVPSGAGGGPSSRACSGSPSRTCRGSDGGACGGGGPSSGNGGGGPSSGNGACGGGWPSSGNDTCGGGGRSGAGDGPSSRSCSGGLSRTCHGPGGGTCANPPFPGGPSTASPGLSSFPSTGAEVLPGSTRMSTLGMTTLLEGFDSNSTYILQMKHLGNPKKARKDVRCFCFEKVVDSDLTNFQDLVESIVDQYPPGYMEIAHLQYRDRDSKTFPEVKTDQDLMLMFEKHKETKVVDMFIAYCHPSEPYEPLTHWHYEDQGQPMQNPSAEPEGTYLDNPSPENEHVGVDEEAMYLASNEPIHSLNVVLHSGCKRMEKEKGTDEEGTEDEEDLDSLSESETEVADELVDTNYEEDHVLDIEHNKEDPPMTEGTTYSCMEAFKLSLSQHAIKHEFEYRTAYSNRSRFGAYCSRKLEDNCPWRIHASTLQDKETVMVKKNPFEHDCSSTRRNMKVANGTKHWVCAKVKDFLIQDPTLPAKELQKKIKEHHKVHIHYKRVYKGKDLALNQLYGDWDSSFDKLYSFKAQIEKSCPGSVVVIDHYTINDKIRFRRFFFALKPCIDGFLTGCRPYLAIDSTFLTGKFKGQLASATAVDGHNWLYPVCFGVFDSETNENWIWFMQMLKEAIGSPRGLAISTDAGQPVMTGVGEVFPEAEHRECMFHLVTNFKKKFHGKVFDDHLWAASYSWNQYIFEKHWFAMEKAKPAATAYLRNWHKKLWTRSQFSTNSKVDYVTNNLAESFNNWIKEYKSMNLDDFMDKIRQLIMIKWNQRRKVSKKLEGLILPHIIKRLNERSRELELEVLECSEYIGEVTALGGTGFRFIVNLQDRTCSCRQWQVSGIPCKHAIAFITSLRSASLENYVDLYYSIEKFRAAYCQLIPAMPDKSQWPKGTHGFFLHPPLLKATSGRRKNVRFKGCTEKKMKKSQHKCPICKDYGHHWHNCKNGSKEDMEAMRELRGPPKKKKRRTKAAIEASLLALEDDTPAACMSFPPCQILEPATSQKEKSGSASLGVEHTTKKGKRSTSSSGASASQSVEPTTTKKGKGSTSSSSGSTRSKKGSNEPEPMSIEGDHTNSAARHASKTTKAKPKVKSKPPKPKAKGKMKNDMQKIPMKSLDSPAMGTRSKGKMVVPPSPAMSTRSKRRLSL